HLLCDTLRGPLRPAPSAASSASPSPQPSTTWRPIARAEPSMIFVAAAMSFAFRSFILASAISASCERLIVPALSLPGSFEPDLIRAAFFRRKEAGGVLVVKEK